MTIKHTPGPWVVNLDQVDCGEGKLSIEAPGEYFIAQVDSSANQEANARLIAAAPELLKLAQRVAALNRDAGQIGAGMLATLVDEARGLTE